MFDRLKGAPGVARFSKMGKTSLNLVNSGKLEEGERSLGVEKRFCRQQSDASGCNSVPYGRAEFGKEEEGIAKCVYDLAYLGAV